MDNNQILHFLLAAITLTLMPGPDIIMVITESITKGKKEGLLFAIGLCSGLIIHSLLVVSGVSIIIQNSDVAYSLIKYFGAGYLLYLAYQEYLSPAQLEEVENIEFTHLFTYYKRGFLMNVLNPKVTIFFIAFLPLFVHPDGLPPSKQLMIFSLLFIIQALIIMCSVALLAGYLRRFLRNSKFWRVTKWVKILILILLSVYLLV